ncbi:MAG: hypothetical protein U0X87_02230 [Anaerolineales bacterium]
MSHVAPLANGLMSFPPTKKLIARALGLADERPLPRFQVEGRNCEPRETRRHGEKIIFLSDVFSRYIEPLAEKLALEVLTMCGYDVQVLPIVGAGASLLSKGFVDAARRHARKNVEVADQADLSREAFIVGVELPGNLSSEK